MIDPTKSDHLLLGFDEEVIFILENIFSAFIFYGWFTLRELLALYTCFGWFPRLGFFHMVDFPKERYQFVHLLLLRHRSTYVTVLFICVILFL